ncbi:MAG: hypothetical protein L6R42_001204 [Xanthoria sp. 1 TBL-2021]|nr:MAG: hypothetical protein L6R42_001204 [Xanthoria sp. 1 TBL-2021]
MERRPVASKKKSARKLWRFFRLSDKSRPPPRPARTFSLQRQLFNSTLYSRLLDLWFSDLSLSATDPALEHVGKWFGIGASPEAKLAFDAECAYACLPALRSIAADKYPLPPFQNAEQDRENYDQIAEPFIGPLNTANTDLGHDDAALALVLLLDQMSRNIFRDQQDIIYGHYDRIARAVAYAIYSRGLDQSDRYSGFPLRQAWLYFPLMHSEALSDHQLLDQELEVMRLRMELRSEKGEKHASEFLNNIRTAEQKHRVILERFGRYPHRNKVLGRKHTKKEQEFLDSGGDTFGTS